MNAKQRYERRVVYAAAVILALAIWAGVDSCRSTAERDATAGTVRSATLVV